MTKRTYKRNTTKNITLNYTPLNGVAGATAFLTVKPTEFDSDSFDNTAIIKQTIAMTDNTAVFELTPATLLDTVLPGKYFFDISAKDVEGNIYSIDSGEYKITAGSTNREA